MLAAAALLVAVNLVIASRERLLEEGRVVLLELTPVDPRSLMQGDYMALRFKAARDAFQTMSDAREDGRLVLALDSRGVATYVRRDDGAALAADEVRIRYRVRHGAPKFATNGYFFEEGRANDFAKARYGEFRVAPDGEAILTGLRDEALKSLGGPRKK
ncbi:MAG: GDYXXLXY domain-containing protein [Casimicrobiaceae bacterium]